MRYFILLFLFMMAATKDSQAQSAENTEKFARAYLLSRVGTISATSLPQFADGSLYGCVVEFSALLQDFGYKGGEFIRVTGSVGILTANKNIVVSLKTIVHDINPKTMEFSPSPPTNANLISGAKSSKPFLLGKTPSDTPGALFVLFNTDGTLEILMDAIRDEKITISFNRKPNGVDIQVPIDFRVQDTDSSGTKKFSSAAKDGFSSCVGELVRSEKKK